ncbi:folylpolyglutamate synthase/dihydrofolate synthase family protein [Lysinibacillus sp. Bpr_S20]|uniref:bifunctional folylpolyglutamate synthase/dihydrofolate synthase n=1 Tax=Lysinibacillus sp. Bpr_S20 TaxID=2933964 RepID=UPI00201228A8|nr:folylpolyglutamate synthase/dihydrofolate synthase family protein [Lysinibacillus sp. Bpr_S20]MCL1701274.1 bifunctional folylpolyglutamate synthase/dihydrofolate synthase [Lysinibacillus sp. Bpr_S20]
MFKTMKECTDFIFTLKAVDHKRAPLVLMREVLALLNNPQDRLRAIHLAGSNGKGSTVNALREMLQHAGYKVGAFTSPHLKRVNERMTINGIQISDAQFLHYMNRVFEIIETHYEGEFPSFFEVVTLIMYQYFADEEVDIALIETGLGGRLDATNVITPLISIITTISLEHTAFLGDTLAKVAFEKAGIIKENVPIIVGVKSEEALTVIREVAKERHAPCLVLGKDFTVENIEQGTTIQRFNYRKANAEMVGVPLKMAGPHQMNNASLAITAILTLRENGVIDISDESIHQALAKAQWAGRFEQLPGDIILDGAHNSEGTNALIQTLKTVYPQQNYRFIYAALADKDHAKSIALMDSIATSIAFTQIELPNAMPADQLAALSTNVNKEYNADWREMVQTILHQRNKEDVIVITGSLYFIAEIRQWLQGEQ